MNERDTFDILQSDVVIPEVVQRKADMAFEQIRKSDMETEYRRKPHMKKKGIIILIAAAVLSLGSITAFAAYQNWSRGLSESLRISPEQKTELETTSAAAFADQSQTQNGVTVTAQQSITDNYFTHLSFRVDGYELPKDSQENYLEPCFENVNILINGKPDFRSMSGSFYDGLVTGPDGRVVYADGSPIDYDAPGSLSRYVREDGSLEYLITLYHDEKGYFLDKEIIVEFENLGTVSKAEYQKEHEVNGKWSFCWNLQGSDSKKEYTLDEPLGDTGATVIRAEISPISMHIEYDFPYSEYTETGYDQDGNPIESTHFVEVPPLAGVQLKDGTVYQYLCNGGSEGYADKNSEIYHSTYANDRIIDPDEVAYIIFRKQIDGVYSVSDFYRVPVE